MCREGADATKAQLVAETQNQVFFKEEFNFYIFLILNITKPIHLLLLTFVCTQVEDRLLELCGYFGSFTDACRMAVVERADQLYAFITSQSWEEGVCDLAGVCSEVSLGLSLYKIEIALFPGF